MRTLDVSYSTTIMWTNCGKCGIPFGLPEDFMHLRQSDGHSFYCPNGHYIRWFETAAQRLQHAEAQIAHLEDQRRAAERSNRTLKGHLTRLRNRIAAGICPWCHRHFTNVERHVKGQHPDHAEKMREALA